MKNNKTKKLVALVLLMSLVLITTGVSYAFFTYMKSGSTENTITTGSLTFVYDEKEAQGNGINMTNVFPVSDETGKTLIGINNVFDFQVLASTKGVSINYEVIVDKQSGSDLPEDIVKIYLTTLSGETETEVSSTIKNNVVTNYKELVSTTIENQTGKTLHQEVIASGQKNYSKQFRLRMWLSESATNQTEGEWDYNNKNFSVKVNVVANGETAMAEAKANAPELIEGMIPVVYDNVSSSWKKADTTNEWYDYNSQEWANAVTVTSTNRTTLMNSPVGTTVPMTDINTMWVWIPKYEYQYTNLGDTYAGGSQTEPGEIKVNFLSKSTATPSDASTYKIHPAFKFGEKELSGIWYGKFETSTKEVCTANEGSINTDCDLTTLTPQIKPSVTSWRGVRPATMFTASRGMQINNYATYGFANNTNYDTHMSKDTEWGAVAYLSQSKYGKYGNPSYTGVNKEVAINNCSNFITGIGGDTVSASGSSTSCTTNTYETAKGQSASTTGNITGVYDMSGGANEYTMSVLADSNGIPRSGRETSNNSGFNGMLGDGSTYSSGINFPDAKYYDLYTSETMNTACSGGICFGQALSETGSWYGDAASFVFDYSSWIMRGGQYNYAAYTGVFSTYYSDGDAYFNYSGRLALTP